MPSYAPGRLRGVEHAIGCARRHFTSWCGDGATEIHGLRYYAIATLFCSWRGGLAPRSIVPWDVTSCKANLCCSIRRLHNCFGMRAVPE